MPLCPFCEAIKVSHLPTASGLTQSSELEAAPSQHHHPSFTSLKTSAQSCEICDIILKRLEKSQGKRLRGAVIVPKGYTDYMVVAPHLSDEPVSLRGLSRDGWSPDKKRMHGIQVTCGYIVCEFGLYADEASLASASGMVIGKRPDAVGECRRHLEWLETCIQSHSICSRYQSLFASKSSYPSRLLDLKHSSTTTDVALVDGAECQGEPYVALSHCWGAIPVVRTMKATLLAFKAKIDRSALNKTFNDAIDVTRKLGIRYLWIDSLCIIQDDSQDWDREAARMAQVYSQAYVTIAASSASDGSYGLLRKEPSEPFVRLHWPKNDGESFNNGVVIGPPSRKFHFIDQEPLNTRAWTLQERVLSPRTLHFAADQVHWECRQSLVSETGSPPYRYGAGHSVESSPSTGWLAKMTSDLIPDLIPVARNESPPAAALADPSLKYQNWYRMLRNYTERNITKASDRLPALSGLARAYFTKHKSKYLAGIWLDDLAYGLLWYVQSTETAHYPVTYLAPSWSWAAVEGSPVNFLAVDFLGRWPGEEDEIELINHSIDLDGFDPYGRVTEGVLTLRAYVKRARIKTIQEDEEYEGTRASTQFLVDEISAIGWVGMDVPTPDDEIYCLLVTAIYLDNYSNDYKPNGILLLRPAGVQGEYKRVGIAGLFTERDYNPMKTLRPPIQSGTVQGRSGPLPSGKPLNTWFDDVEMSIIHIS